jgi:hypothetical protein
VTFHGISCLKLEVRFLLAVCDCYRSDIMDWIDVAADRDQWRALVSTIMNLWVPQNNGKFLNSCTIGGFSRRAQLHECVCACVHVGGRERLLIQYIHRYSPYLEGVSSIQNLRT